MLAPVGLIISRLFRKTVFLMILHLLAILSVALLSPQLIFSPRLPILTIACSLVSESSMILFRLPLDELENEQQYSNNAFIACDSASHSFG